MQKSHKFLFAVVLSLLGLAAPQSARAQFIGYTSPQTVQQNVVPAGTLCTGAPQNVTVNNLGQNTHFLTYSITNGGSPLQVVVKLLSLDNAGGLLASDVSTNTQGLLTANGYYVKVQVSITCTSGATIVSATYYGTSGNAVPLTGIGDHSAYSKLIAQNISGSGNLDVTAIATPYGSSCGRLFFIYSAAVAGSTITVNSQDDSSFAVQTPLPTTTLLNNTTLQVFPVSCVEATTMAIHYVAGGAATFSVVYMFDKPGAQMGADPCGSNGVVKSSKVITAPATATTQIVAASGNASIYVCGFQGSQSAAGAFQWEYGTGASCGTGTTALTGVETTLSGQPVLTGYGQTVFTAPGSNALCIVTSTAGTFNGVLTYVQQ